MRSDIARLCSHDGARQEINMPFAVEYDGKTWCCATDGTCLLARSDLPAEVVDGAPHAAAVLSTAIGTGTATTVAHLRVAFGSPLWGDPCPHCGQKVGQLWPAPVDRVACLGRNVNAVLGARLMDCVADGPCEVGQPADPEGPLWFRGETWIALLMPIRVPIDGLREVTP